MRIGARGILYGRYGENMLGRILDIWQSSEGPGRSLNVKNYLYKSIYSCHLPVLGGTRKVPKCYELPLKINRFLTSGSPRKVPEC